MRIRTAVLVTKMSKERLKIMCRNVLKRPTYDQSWNNSCLRRYFLLDLSNHKSLVSITHCVKYDSYQSKQTRVNCSYYYLCDARYIYNIFKVRYMSFTFIAHWYREATTLFINIATTNSKEQSTMDNSESEPVNREHTKNNMSEPVRFMWENFEDIKG